jgi:hypothetical protein
MKNLLIRLMGDKEPCADALTVLSRRDSFRRVRSSRRSTGSSTRREAVRLIRDNSRVRWGATLAWITVGALVAALVSQLLGWEPARTAILIAWVVLVFLAVMSRGMRGTSILTYLSAAALLGAAVSQLAGWTTARGWFLLAWAALLLPVAIGLFSHPMRVPAWGVFVGFWGTVGVLWLIVVQILAVAGSLSGAVYHEWAAWPVAVVGVWFLVASGLGFGAERFPRWVDSVGLLAGAGLVAISVFTWIGASTDAVRAVGLFAAVAYSLWAIGLGWVFWGTQRGIRRSLSPAADRAA